MKYSIGDIVSIKNENDKIWKTLTPILFDLIKPYLGKTYKIKSVLQDKYSLHDAGYYWFDEELENKKEIRKKKLLKIKSNEI